MAICISVCIINLRQAQREGTVNVNMAAQTLLAKLPRSDSLILPPVPPTDTSDNTNSFNLNRNDHELFYKPIFGIVS